MDHLPLYLGIGYFHKKTTLKVSLVDVIALILGYVLDFVQLHMHALHSFDCNSGGVEALTFYMGLRTC